MTATLEQVQALINDHRQQQLRALKQLKIELSHTFRILTGRRETS